MLKQTSSSIISTAVTAAATAAILCLLLSISKPILTSSQHDPLFDLLDQQHNEHTNNAKTRGNNVRGTATTTKTHGAGIVWCQSQQVGRMKIHSPSEALPTFGSLIPIPDFYESNCYHDFFGTLAFFHVGGFGGDVSGDGGITIERNLLQSRIGHTTSYLEPNPGYVEQLKSGPYDQLIMNVQDPVDRFVSAFQSTLEECGPESLDPDQCGERGTDEWSLLNDKYESDPNVLAEAMCEESHSLEETLEDYDLNMSFMGNKRPLSSWLDFLMDDSNQEDGSISKAGIQQLFSIPVEQQMGHKEVSSSAEQHIQTLILHLLEGRYGPDRAREVLAQQPQEPKRVHPTEVTASPSTLSPLGECCMARTFRKDYQLIQAMMLGTDSSDSTGIMEPLPYTHPAVSAACSYGSEDDQELCKADLITILSRRSQYLDLSLGSCSDVVSNIAVIESHWNNKTKKEERVRINGSLSTMVAASDVEAINKVLKKVSSKHQ